MAEDEYIVEERKALIVSFAEGDVKPVFRTAHFLKPTFNGSRPPLLPQSSFSRPSGFEPSKCPLKVSFCSWKNPSLEWTTWATQMELKHRATWEKAGILEAIRASRLPTLPKDPDLLYNLGRRWSPDTNTFIFPWGEATVTLEDVMVTGAYSVLGSPVYAPLETEEKKAAEAQLEREWSQLSKIHHYKVQPPAWVNRFMGKGSEIEHEAFLVLWLSRFVLPKSKSLVHNTFRAAIHLSRGTRVALAPAVLAAIFRDLSLLKRGIDLAAGCSGSYGTDYGHGALTINVWSPFQLVQVWIWERFPTVRPNPGPSRDGEPRILRWIKRKPRKIPNLGKVLDSGMKVFRWRPYAHPLENPKLYNFYPVNKMWVKVGSDTDDELLSFARFLMPCELVGLDDCVGQYLPHRVAMQFGMDQDLPSPVARSSLDPKIARATCARPITNMKVYIPSRVSEAALTTRYSEWWEESKRGSKAPMEIEDAGQFKKTPKGLKVLVNNNVQEKMGEINSSVPPGFKRKRDKVNIMDLGDSSNPKDPKGSTTKVQMKMNALNSSIPPGFEPKQNEDVTPGFEAKHSEPKNPELLIMSVAQTKMKGINLSVHPESELKQNENVPPGFEAKRSQPKNPEVLMSVGQSKMKDVDLIVRPGSEQQNEVELLDSDDSSDEDHLPIEQLLKRQKRDGIGNSAGFGSKDSPVLHVVSSTSDNSPLRRDELLVEDVQSIVEDEANTKQLKRTEDSSGNPSESGSAGKNSLETRIKNLRNRLSKAEEFFEQYYARRRAMKA